MILMMMMIDDWPARKFVQFSTIQLPPTHTSARRPIGPNLSRTASDDTQVYICISMHLYFYQTQEFVSVVQANCF